jgi:hypothetical protein
MSAYRGRAEVIVYGQNDAIDPQRTQACSETPHAAPSSKLRFHATRQVFRIIRPAGGFDNRFYRETTA